MHTQQQTSQRLEFKNTCVQFMFAYQQKDVPAMLGFFSENATVDFMPLGEGGKGLAAELGKAVWTGLIQSFPDLDNTVDATIATDEENIRCQVVIRGTQAADFADVPNKNKSFESDHIFIFRLDPSGKIEHLFIEWDHADFKKQLGA